MVVRSVSALAVLVLVLVLPLFVTVAISGGTGAGADGAAAALDAAAASEAYLAAAAAKDVGASQNSEEVSIEEGSDSDLIVEDDELGIDYESRKKELLEADAAAAAAAAQATEVEDVSWEDISGNLTVVHPEEGSELNGTATAVRLNVATNCLDPERFQKKYNDSNICISMDNSPYACWPIFKLSRFPLFTNLTKGSHTLIAKLVDPVSGDMLMDSTMTSASFIMLGKSDSDDEGNDEKGKDKDSESDEENDEENPEQETIPIPQVGVEFPTEDAGVPPTFEARLHIMTEANLTQFKRLMADSFICLALDDATFQSCWPIFEDSYYPKFFDLTPGRHTLVAYLLHPNTLDIIDGTAVGIRTFWVAEKDAGIVPMQLNKPSSGSNAFSPEMQQQALEAEKQSEQQQQQQQQAPANGVPDVEITTDDNDVATIVLQINVDTVRKVLRVGEHEDFISRAAQFCVENNIMGQSCVKSIVRLIEIELQRWRDIPHLDLYSKSEL